MGCDLSSLQYLRRWKSLNQMSNNSGTPDYGNTGSGMSTVKSVSMFTNLMAQSSKFVMEGVKNLVVKRHNLPVTKIVDELMEVIFITAKTAGLLERNKSLLKNLCINIYIISELFLYCRLNKVNIKTTIDILIQKS